MDVELYTPPSVIAVRREVFEVGDEVRVVASSFERGFVTAIYDGWLEVITDQLKEVLILFY